MPFCACLSSSSDDDDTDTHTHTHGGGGNRVPKKVHGLLVIAGVEILMQYMELKRMDLFKGMGGVPNMRNKDSRCFFRLCVFCMRTRVTQLT